MADTQPLNFAKLTSSQAEDSYSLSEEDVTEASAEERGLGRDLSDHVVFSTSCHLIAPCVVAPGSLTITSSAMFFTVDEDEPECKNLDPKVGALIFALSSIHFILFLFFTYLRDSCVTFCVLRDTRHSRALLYLVLDEVDSIIRGTKDVEEPSRTGLRPEWFAAYSSASRLYYGMRIGIWSKIRKRKIDEETDWTDKHF